MGLVKVRFRIHMTIVDDEPMRRLRLSGHGSGPMGSAKGDGRIELKPVDNGTQVSYDYVFTLTGKIVSVGARLIESASGVVLRQLFERLGHVAGGKKPPVSLWQRLLAFLGIRT